MNQEIYDGFKILLAICFAIFIVGLTIALTIKAFQALGIECKSCKRNNSCVERSFTE